MSGRPLLVPDDGHNRRLVSHVHPPDWTNPDPADRYHLVVVGGGTAGLVTAAIAAGLGAKVALVERHLLGGDCLNVGCVPSKGVISAARAWHRAKTAHEVFGAPELEKDGGGDFACAMERMRRLRAGISPADGAPRFRGLGVDVFFGEGCFVAADALEVDGRRLIFRSATIATGGRAAAPPIPGLAEAGYLTNETIFSLTELPKRFGVIGAGPIGSEMAQSFARFGSEVSLFDVASRILPRDDADAAAIVEEALVADGVRLHLGASIQAVEGDGEQKVVVFQAADGEVRKVAVDELLVSVGRVPNTDGLGLEAAGVAYDKRGVRVDDKLRTTNRRIFAAGDIASDYKFTHAADAMARIVVRNAFFFGRGRASRLVIPWTTYTSPEVAHVGLHATEAEKLGYKVETLTIRLADVDRARLDGEDEGFLRVHLKKGSDRILGATLVAAHAGDMIGTMSLAITHGLGLSKFSSTLFPYPTQGEVFRKAGDAYNRTKLTPWAARLFELWFQVFR